jgi:hypothetical protein
MTKAHAIATNASGTPAKDADEGNGKSPSKPPPARKKPVLASEVLKEELAPLHPAAKSARWWLLGIAVALGLLGLSYRYGLGLPEQAIDASSTAFGGAAALAGIAILPFPYLVRAAAGLAIGVCLMSLGVSGSGPLGGVAVDGGAFRDITRMVTLTTLPAALLFRVSYRAYGRARVILGIALLLSLPFLVGQILLAANSDVSVITRSAAGLTSAAVLCGLFGFMGSGTTGAGSVWAALVLLVLPAETAFRQLTPLAGPDTGVLLYPAAAVGMLAAGLAASIGLYQVLAAMFAADARKVTKTVSAESLNDDDS